MISKIEVEHIAKLARLGLTPAEIKKFQRELSSILDYIEKLKKVDVTGMLATSHPLAVENETREDEAKNQKFKNNSQKLLDLAPKKKEGFIKVKSVFK